jgi:two-component system phosphate regulon sensor histidine kinase PhoR
MSRKLIWILTLFMGLALASLIIVQAYWIKNAVLVKDKQFDQLITRSMIDISREIEQRETNKIIMHHNEPISDDTGFISQSRRAVPLPPRSAFRDPAQDTMVIGRMNRQEADAWLKNRREFINRVIGSMFLLSPEIEKRISPVEMEETIRTVLNETGIDLPFEYAVIRWNNEMAFGSPGYNPAAEAEYYRVQLFPEDVFHNSNFLNVYFPEKKTFLFKSLSYIAISSLVLTLAIVLSVAFSVVIIFRQKRLSEIRNDFVSNMTHELKTPISTISLASQMLGDKSIPSEVKNTEQIAKIITEECRRLGNQVEKVLQTSVFDKGRLKLRLGEVNIHEIITGAIENFSIQVRARNGKISSSLMAENFILQADQVHFINVLSNLLDNAIKYCTRNPEIRIETADKNGFVEISVSDNGIGINKNDQKRIFERFYRVPTGNVHTVKGFGLGLSYVKMIVEEHQGHIELDSELYEGSTFKIYLPLKDYGNQAKDQDIAGRG